MTARRHIIPIFLPQWGCPYHCVYCDQRAITSQLKQVNVFEQIKDGLVKVSPKAYPVEVAFYGGTFTALPLKLQQELLQTVRPFLTDGRVSSIRLSTHPACLDEQSLEVLQANGVKTVELGVQSMDPEVLRRAGRIYGPEIVAAAVKRLKQRNLQVGLQLMPGLPGDTKAKSLASVGKVIELKPDFVRVYPTVVIEGTALAELWRAGEYRALELDEAVSWCKEIAKLFAAAQIPIIRMGLHPSNELAEQVLAGPYHPAFKALVDSALALEQIEVHLAELDQSIKRGQSLAVSCNPKEITVVRGERNGNILQLKAKYGFSKISVSPDPLLDRGSYVILVPAT